MIREDVNISNKSLSVWGDYIYDASVSANNYTIHTYISDLQPRMQLQEVHNVRMYNTIIIRIQRIIQFNVRNSILAIYHESNST